MNTKTEPTFWVKIYMSGPISIAEQVCRERCKTGLCVTIEPTKFIYTGGEEIGFVIGLINYPRFPSSTDELTTAARDLAKQLIERTCQHSALVQTPEITEWLTTRPEAA